MSYLATDDVRVISPRVSVWQRLRFIVSYRELLVGLVRKELKVKYKNSSLGFFWSMLNPALYLVVFFIVFVKVLGNGIPQFPVFLLCGLLVWNLFSTALGASTASIVGNASIVKKVAFPREILPLASVGASMVHFCLQGVVLVLALVVFNTNVAYSYLPLLIPAMIALILFTAACAVFLAAINVYMRDVQHLLELVLLAWFWATPIVYPYGLVQQKLEDWVWVYLLNPITPIVLTFQKALYNVTIAHPPNGDAFQILPVGVDQWWYFGHLMEIIVVSSVLFIGALAVFGRVEGNFAEEL